MLGCINILLRGVTSLVAILLLGCGGGGGGGSSSDAFSVSPTRLTFTAIQQGVLPNPQFVTGTLHNNSPLYIEIQVSSSSLSVDFEATSQTTARLTVRPMTTNLAPGTYNETISVIGCSDYYCSTGQVAGSPKVINVVYTIQPRTGLRATPQSISFSQVRGSAAPAAQLITLSDLGDASYAWNAAISYISGSGWLSINGASQASGASLPASPSLGIAPLTTLGSYSALVRVTTSNSTLDIPVSYTLREPQITTTPTSLSFSAISHDALSASRSLVLGAEMDLSSNYTVAVNYGSGATGWLTVPNSGVAPGNLSINANRTSLNPGTYTATLLITTASRTVSVPVTYILRAPQVTRSPAQLNFNAFRGGQVPSVQSFLISTENNISVPYTSSISYGAGASGWLTVPASGTSPGNVSATINTTNLNVGTYSATVTVRPAYGAASFTLAVSYQVQEASLTITPSDLRYTITGASVTADLSKSVTIGDTGVALSWSATASPAWLAVDTASGTTAGNGSTTTIPVRLITSELNALASGYHGGVVTVRYNRPDASIVTVQLPVTLTMNLPAVNYVAPYVAISNTSEKIILRGTGFDHTAMSTLRIGSQVVTGFSIVNDTEIQVVHPALAAGRYSVSVSNTLNLNVKSQDLVVVDPIQYGFAFMSSTNYPGKVIYDAERQAIYSVRSYFGGGAYRLERHRYIDGVWIADSLPLAGIFDIALTPDGKEILATASQKIYHIDPVSMSILFQYSLAQFGYPYTIYPFQSIEISNNGVALVSLGGHGMMLYNALTRVLITTSRTFYCSSMGASGDGSRIVVGDSCLNGILHYYNSSTDQFVSTGNNMSSNLISLDRTGMKSNIWGSIYDDKFNLIGNVPDTWRTTISADGNKAYNFIISTNYSVPSTVKIYDLTNRDSFGNFAQLGEDISVTDSVGEYNYNLIATPDGRNLILYGDQGLIVQPLP